MMKEQFINHRVPKLSSDEELERDEAIGYKYNKIFDQKMKKAKAKLDNKVNQSLTETEGNFGLAEEADYTYKLEILR